MVGSILIVSRNNIHLTKKAVASALAQSVPATVMVVDNASEDGTIQWLRTKDVVSIHAPYQRSLAVCWNDGIKAFWRAGRTEVLVINNDVELIPETYQILRGIQRPFVTGVGVNDRAQLSSRIELNFSPHPDFSCFMIKRDVTDRVGWFDESYFPAYFEDNDYHVRMHRAGIEAVSVDVPFYHEGSGTLKQASDKDRKIIERGFAKNKAKFRETYGCVPGDPGYDQLFA